MWVIGAFQIVLSVALLLALFITITWLRSNAEDGRETKRHIARLSATFHQMQVGAYQGPSPSVNHAPVKARQGGSAPAPMPLESMTDSRRTAGLTVAMSLPVIERRMVAVTREEDDEAQARPTVEVTPSRPLAVKVGAEVVELDAGTVARIEALQEDAKAGRLDGSLLLRVIDAGLSEAEGPRVSGEAPCEPVDRDSGEDVTQLMGERERLTILGIAPQVAEGPMPASSAASGVVSTKPTGR
jgi:hypothetical protein